MLKVTLAFVILAFASNLVSSQRVLWCYVSFETICTFYHEDIKETDQVVVKGNHWNTTDDDIWKIEFEESKIHFLPTDMFSIFGDVHTLSAPGQELKEIRPGTFLGAKSLEAIELSNNKLQKLGEDSFKGADIAFILNLNHNEIEVIHENAFRGLTELVSLDLMSNKLRALPIGIFNSNVFLGSIHLEFNNLNSISFQSFEHLIQLWTLGLSRNVCINRQYYGNAEFLTLQKDLINCGMPFVNEAARTTETDDLKADLEIFNSNFDSLKQLLEMVDESLIDIVDRIEDIEHILKNKTSV
jgi:hypothetical protein